MKIDLVMKAVDGCSIRIRNKIFLFPDTDAVHRFIVNLLSLLHILTTKLLAFYCYVRQQLFRDTSIAADGPYIPSEETPPFPAKLVAPWLNGEVRWSWPLLMITVIG
jgi:hypothetical protein